MNWNLVCFGLIVNWGSICLLQNWHVCSLMPFQLLRLINWAVLSYLIVEAKSQCQDFVPTLEAEVIGEEEAKCRITTSFPMDDPFSFSSPNEQNSLSLDPKETPNYNPSFLIALDALECRKEMEFSMWQEFIAENFTERERERAQGSTYPYKLLSLHSDKLQLFMLQNHNKWPLIINKTVKNDEFDHLTVILTYKTYVIHEKFIQTLFNNQGQHDPANW